jgi:hypothetical protein
MRLVRFNRHSESPTLARLGAVLPDDRVVDLRAAYARYLVEVEGDPQGREIAVLRMPPAIGSFLQLGQAGCDALTSVLGWIGTLSGTPHAGRGLADEELFAQLSDCRLHAPVRLTKLIVADPDAAVDGLPHLVLKPHAAVVGPTRDITFPAGAGALGFAAGIAVVIGTKCKNIAEADCPGCIAGYTVMTDVKIVDPSVGYDAFSSRMFESFSPSGPWLATPEEIEAIDERRIRGSVNGELCQDYCLRDLPWTVARIISFASRMGLDAGDAIWVGSAVPVGVARQLRADDVVEASLDGLGMIRNRIVKP